MKLKQDKPAVGVVIARFQVASLTEAHVDLIKTVQAEHEKVLLFLGLSAAVGTKNNPLDLEMRRQMILGYKEPIGMVTDGVEYDIIENGIKYKLPFKNVNILYVKDQPSDEGWSKNLDAQIRDNLAPGQSPLLYGGRDSFIKHYKGKFQTQELIPTSIMSGTAMRDAISKKTKNCQEFREGVIWAVYNQFPRVFATVDVALIDCDKGTLLLGRKENETKLRFIGGFADPSSPSFEFDAARELEEETGAIVKPENLVYVGSTLVDDWRYRGECDKIKTILYFAPFAGGDVKADDDIAEVRWVNYKTLSEDMLVDTHKPLYHLLRQFFRKEGNRALYCNTNW